MKKSYFILLFLFIISSASAQQDTTTVFQSARGYYVDPVRAKFNKKVTQNDSLWIVSLYDKKEILQERVSFADKNLEIRKGPYLLNENGSVREQGNYNRGYKSGEWIVYYSNKQIRESANFRWDLLDGQYISYWPNGQLKKQGFYLAGRKIKRWVMFYENGKPALSESYDDFGKLLNAVYFDANGEESQVPSFYNAPTYPGGIKSFYNFLFKEIKNKKSNAIYANYGTVELEFIVKIDGSITDITVNGNSDSYLERDLISVMKLSGNWIPAKELGDPIRARHIIPIKFFSN